MITLLQCRSVVFCKICTSMSTPSQKRGMFMPKKGFFVYHYQKYGLYALLYLLMRQWNYTPSLSHIITQVTTDLSVGRINGLAIIPSKKHTLVRSQIGTMVLNTIKCPILRWGGRLTPQQFRIPLPWFFCHISGKHSWHIRAAKGIWHLWLLSILWSLDYRQMAQ